MLKFVVFTLKIVCLQVAEGNCYEMLSETIFVDCGHNALNEPNKENIPENEPSGSKQLMSTSFQPITFASINVDLDEKKLAETDSKLQ
ncbi:hypothetical protein RN001_008330 [Aquatica leii]|uniref:Uncharacterized protein n=1 Tax=Aquatica leii TaxID=1421715 RepID=A0AAN7SH79_9COLE|nr:hypothetical protein RN001_008330 [Aquatica leii]